MLDYKIERVVTLHNWNKLVTNTYGRIYDLQQQDGCKERQRIRITIPDNSYNCDYENDTVPEEVNHEDMGVSFNAWLARNPEQPLDSPDEWDRINGLELWWSRNFYPDIQMVANDLYEKGLIEAGKYTIEIDW